MGMVFGGGGGGLGGLRGGGGGATPTSQFPLAPGPNVLSFVGRPGSRSVQVSPLPTTVIINNISVVLNITKDSAGQTLLKIVNAGIPAHLDSFGVLYIDIPGVTLAGDIPTLQALGLL